MFHKYLKRKLTKFKINLGDSKNLLPWDVQEKP